MSRAQDVGRRYVMAGSVIRQGVEIFAVGDPAGARLNSAIRRTLLTLGEERSEAWNGVIRAARTLRWRRMTQPQPTQFQTQRELINCIVSQAEQLRNLVSEGHLLDLLAEAAVSVGESSSPVGSILLESIHEVGPKACTIIVSNGAARAGLVSWLDELGVSVILPSELERVGESAEISYVVGPPCFMPLSVLTAPVTPEVTFVMPAWFGDRSLPVSAFGAYAEGQIVVKTTVRQIGNSVPPEDVVADNAEIKDAYFPQHDWGTPPSGDREPNCGEVEAWKALLAGGQSLWLDSGERIRSLDPKQPEGARIGYEVVETVDAGTYLVLREGEAERGAMRDQALLALGERASDILATQESWKKLLEDKLSHVGPRRSMEELDRLGVRSSGQVRAWSDPRLVCPQRDTDFALLLDWLGVPVQPTYDNALILRRAVYRASADLRKELEEAVGRSDLRGLERDGILHLDLPSEGLRGMFVARVLAKAPFTEVVSRHQVRVPFVDGSAQWLE